MKGETIFDRMRKGMPIGRLDPEIDRFDKAIAEGDELRMEYNTSHLNRDQRKELLEKILHAKVKGATKVIPPFHFDFGFNIHLGENDIVNYDVVMLDDAEIFIGDNVLIGPGAKFVTASHPKDIEMREMNPFMTYAEPIKIGNNVWIGAGAIILPGITVGDDAIVGAGAVVTHDVEPRTIVVGNPAKILRRL